MKARAGGTSRKAGLDIEFKNGVTETLAFPDGQFDVVLSTLMLHHLPSRLREDSAREMRRVLKPGGRVLILDFWGMQSQRGVLAHFQRHGHMKPGEVTALPSSAGLKVVDSGSVGIKDLHFTLATVPRCRT